jgi:hypothetical protein
VCISLLIYICRVVSPIIKNIDAITWEDSGSSGYQMIFRWTFEFSWYVDNTNYIPIISGGILAVTKKWWVLYTNV